MASYTDTPLTANSFRPYVQQIPVEAETQVGMTLQGRYDQGYQRIQSQIDKVAGLSVMRDVDKTYLKSKMNELGNNLRMVSMGDFSNYQLVNSVGGMVNQVGNDPYVQTAVTSTARIQKELSTMDAAQKAGKSDKNNEAYFYDKVLNPYLNAGLKDNNGKPVSFNGSFSPYVDITSEVQKLAKDAGLDETVLQQMYATDTNGKIQFDRNPKSPTYGQAIPARTMTQVENQSNAKALQGILTTVLSRGDVQNQLGIDAWANTRGVDPSTMLAGYQQEYNDRFHAIDDQAAQWNTLLAGNVSDEQKAELQNNLKQLADTKTQYQNQLKGLVSLAQSDPEAFKQQMYKNNYENSLKNMFLKTKREEKNLDNPYTKQLNWEADYKLKSEIERGNLAVSQGHLAIDQATFNATWERDPATGKWIKNDRKTSDGTTDNSRIEFGANTPYIGGNATQRNLEDINGLSQKSDQLGLTQMYDMWRRSPNIPKKSEEEFKKYVEQKAKDKGVSTSDYVYRFLKEGDDNAREMGIELNPRDRDAIKDYINIRNDITGRIAVTKQVDNNLKEKHGIDPKQFENDVLPASATLPDGTPISYSREDMINSILYDTDPSVKLQVDSQGGIDILRKHIMNVLRKKYGADEQPVVTDEYGHPVQMANRFNVENTPEWQSLMKLQGSDKLRRYKDLANEKEKIMEGIVGAGSNISIPVDVTTKEGKDIKSRLHSFVVGVPDLTGENYDYDKILQALDNNESGLSFVINKPYKEGDPFTGVAYISSKGQATRTVIIKSQDALETLTGKKFEGYKVNPYKSFAQTSRTYSTSTTDPANENAWKSSIIPSDIFTGLQNSKKYNPLGTVLTLSYNGKTWIPTIYLREKGKDETRRLTLKGLYAIGSESKIFSDIGNLDDPIIDNMIKNRQK